MNRKYQTILMMSLCAILLTISLIPIVDRLSPGLVEHWWYQVRHLVDGLDGSENHGKD
jgi:hypothetical protein